MIDDEFITLPGDYGRSPFTVPSWKCQTILAKAILEHVQDSASTIAATALASKSIQNSSLAVNCATNVQLDELVIPLFDSVFDPSSALAVQFCPRMYFQIFFSMEILSPEFHGQLTRFVNTLVKSKYFSKALRSLSVDQGRKNFLWYFLSRDFKDNDTVVRGDNNNISPSSSLSSFITYPNLERLYIKNCSFLTSETLSTLVKSAPNLKLFVLDNQLQLDEHHIDSLTQVAPRSLTTLGIDTAVNLCDPGIQFIASRLGGQLKTLKLASCNNLSTAGYSHLGSPGAMIELTSLLLCWSAKLTDEGLREVCNMSALTTLDLEGCGKISDDGIKCVKNLAGSLTSLNVRFCDKISDDGFVGGIALLENLTHLNLGMTSRITDAAFSNNDNRDSVLLKKLKVLNLGGMRSLTQEVLSWLTKLTELRTLVLHYTCYEADVTEKLLSQVTDLTISR